VQERTHLRDADGLTGRRQKDTLGRWKSMVSGHDPKSEGLGGNQDQVSKGKSGDRPRPPTGAGGAQVPRGGQRETQGTPEEKPFSRKESKRRPRDPQTQDKTPKLHLILYCTYQKSPRLGPVDATVVTAVLKRNRLCRWGIPPLIGENSPERSPRPEEYTAEKLDNSKQSQRPATEGKDRSHLPDPPTACGENKDGVPVQWRK
jgi:hypothetical protein